MRLANVVMVIVVGVLALGLAACGGKKSTPSGGLSIVSINLNPGAPAAGSVVQLSATFGGTNNAAGLIKNWTVSAGTLSATKPDFGLLVRQTAKAASVSSVSTTAATVYWTTPPAAASATIDLLVEGKTKKINATVSANPVSLSVTDGDGGTKICTVRVTNITDLYQAAFRINFSSAWRPTAAEAGSFLGAADQILWLGLINQNGFVPCAITKRGGVPGNDGTGELAKVTFAPVPGGSSVHGASALPFDVGLVLLQSSTGNTIPLK